MSVCVPPCSTEMGAVVLTELLPHHASQEGPWARGENVEGVCLVHLQAMAIS
jgi:hypothetical protein